MNIIEDYCAKLRKRHDKIAKLVEEEREALDTLERFPIYPLDTDYLYCLIERIQSEAERLAILTRDYSMQIYPGMSIKELEDISLRAIDYRVSFTPEGWFHLDIPLLPNKKHVKTKSEYISFIAYAIMFKFMRDHPDFDRSRFSQSIIVFRNVVDFSLKSFMISDNDNIEYKHVTNAIAAYFLVDDSPAHLSFFCDTVRGTENRTHVFLIPRKEYAMFVANDISDNYTSLYGSK